MAEHVFLRLGDTLEQVTVAALNADGQLHGKPEQMPLASAAARCEGMSVTVLLPAQDIVSLVVALPAVNAARMRQMLPFSLEDEIAGDVDDLHFALGEKNDAGEFAVSVIAREKLDQWRSLLQAAGISPRRICSEADGIADTPAVTTLYLEGQRALGRRPGAAPFAFDEISLADLWQLLRSEREDNSDLDDVVLCLDSETARERADEIDAWRAGVANVNLKELADGSLPRLAGVLVYREGPNFLQGRYATHSSYAALLRPWRVAAVFALSLIAVAVLGKAAEAWKLKQDDSELRAEINAICSASYGMPDEARCRREMQQRLTGARQPAGSGGTFLQALAAVAGAGGSAIEIDGISFREDVMILDLIVPNAPFLDTFSNSVAGAGDFAVRLQQAGPDGDRYQARLQIVSASR